MNIEKNNITETYKKNIATVIEFLYRNKNTSRTEISKATGLTPAALTKITGDLISQKFLIETGSELKNIPGSGRKQKIITLSPNVGFFIGIEVNIKGIFVVVTDTIGTILNKVAFYQHYNNHDINTKIIELVKEASSPFNTDKILGAGIAIPGHVDPSEQSIVSNNNKWKSFDLSKIQQNFSFPFAIENNIKCMGLGEYLFNAEQSPENFLFFHIGAGMYCSVFHAHHIEKEMNYYIGEIGHTVVDIQGPQCECGKHGCLQTYISESWLIKRAKKLFDSSQITILKDLVLKPSDITLETLIHAYELGDTYLQKLLDKGLDLLAVSIANTLILQNTEKIYLNSELLNYEMFKDKLLVAIHKQLTFIPKNQEVRIEVVPFIPHRGAYGAAALASLTFFIEHPSFTTNLLNKKMMNKYEDIPKAF
ncbi:MAG: ROK family transcriptional regulator [Enterococcus cecorum]|uniref:ROK family protein n=1 Tax=Enterococcus cecorum TaxID=44008 RepID=UPI00197FF1E2|nr:ROK family transcriptional regulator [Enterococcus cecorum]CAI3486380.1 ROK family protein [Enterococcus cecorum]